MFYGRIQEYYRVPKQQYIYMYIVVTITVPYPRWLYDFWRKGFSVTCTRGQYTTHRRDSPRSYLRARDPSTYVRSCLYYAIRIISRACINDFSIFRFFFSFYRLSPMDGLGNLIWKDRAPRMLIKRTPVVYLISHATATSMIPRHRTMHAYSREVSLYYIQSFIIFLLFDYRKESLLFFFLWEIIPNRVPFEVDRYT